MDFTVMLKYIWDVAYIHNPITQNWNKHRNLRRLKTMNNPDQYRTSEENNSIDTLTSRVNKFNNDIRGLEDQLNLLKEQSQITREVLHSKLVERMDELGIKPEPEDEAVLEDEPEVVESSLNEELFEGDDEV